VTLYKRGSIWWYEFEFQGVRIRESSNSGDRNKAGQIERKRRGDLELGTAGISTSQRPLTFNVAAKKWLQANKVHWSESNCRIEGYNVGHLKPHFGRMLLTDITGDSISQYQARRRKAGASPRTVNMEVGTLRAILRKHRLWANVQPDVRMLKAKGEVGRSLTEDERHRLLTACKKSRSRSLYPAVLLSLDTGLRNGELRLLKWRQVDLLERQLIVGKSKSEGGSGRNVPLSEAAFQCMQEWRSQFPDAHPAHYVFPSERYGATPAEGTGLLSQKCLPYEVRPNVPIGSWKVAWTAAREAAKVSCRWHDMRHTFISRVAESQASDSTIMSLAGHLSRKMMERYSHTRNEAKRRAIASFDPPKEIQAEEDESPQNPPQQQAS
jgi:integrase